jgi:hypothetical protein
MVTAACLTIDLDIIGLGHHEIVLMAELSSLASRRLRSVVPAVKQDEEAEEEQLASSWVGSGPRGRSVTGKALTLW